jgi:hypothetical protein
MQTEKMDSRLKHAGMTAPHYVMPECSFDFAQDKYALDPDERSRPMLFGLSPKPAGLEKSWEAD